MESGFAPFPFISSHFLTANRWPLRDIVRDPFGGSGTTLIAAERTGRRARLIDLVSKYADVIVQRWQEQTGQSARLEWLATPNWSIKGEFLYYDLGDVTYAPLNLPSGFHSTTHINYEGYLVRAGVNFHFGSGAP